MPTITLEPDLYTRVEEAAQERRTTIESVVTEATRQYLWELERQKISAEAAIYRQRHAEIVTRYFGEYIAMHLGEVVDHDADMNILWRRVRKRFGKTPIMIALVESAPDRTFTRHDFRFETHDDATSS